MKPIKLANLLFIFVMSFIVSIPWDSLEAGSPKSIEFASLDGLSVTADLYFGKKPMKPFLILFHQAAFSRGEYKPTIPLLLKRGFNMMAVDQRSGYSSHRVINLTAQRAVKKKLKTHYLSAEQDMSAAVDYVFQKLGVKRVILVGSSYSAALVLKIAGEKKYNYAGVVAFSPGEYFGKKNFIATYAKKITAPVWMTSSKKEISRVGVLFKTLTGTKNKTFFKPKLKGEHGSKALWKNSSCYQQYRKSLFQFLKNL